MARNGLNAAGGQLSCASQLVRVRLRRCSVAVHGSLPPRRRREALRLLELARAVLAAHLNRLAADLQLDGVCIQLAVASRTGLLCHDTALRMDPPHSGSDE